MDFHLKLSWGEETGQDDYDLKIAERLWKETVTDILSKVSVLGDPEYILFPIGQDFFHFDTPRVTTTAGTQLDSDTRWQKMFTKGVELLVWAVEQCHALAPVKVMWVPGNHDQMLSYAAVVGLSQRYAHTETIDVDLSPTPGSITFTETILSDLLMGKMRANASKDLCRLKHLKCPRGK